MSSPTATGSLPTFPRTPNKNYTKKNSFESIRKHSFFHTDSTDEDTDSESQASSSPSRSSTGYSSEGEIDSRPESQNSSPLREIRRYVHSKEIDSTNEINSSAKRKLNYPSSSQTLPSPPRQALISEDSNSFSGLELEPLPPASNQAALKLRSSNPNGSSIFTPRQNQAATATQTNDIASLALLVKMPKNNIPDPRIILEMPNDLSEHIASFLKPHEAARIYQLNKATDLDALTNAQERKSEILEKIKKLCQDLPNYSNNAACLTIAKRNMVFYVEQLFYQLYCTPLRRNFTETRYQPILKDFLGAKLFEEVKKLFNFSTFEKDKLLSPMSINLLFNDYRAYNEFDKYFDFKKACLSFPRFLNLLLNIPNYYSSPIILDALSSAYCNIPDENKYLKAFLTYFREKKIKVVDRGSVDDSNQHRFIESSSMPRWVKEGIKVWRNYSGSLKSLIFRIDSQCAFGKKALQFALHHANKKDKSLYSKDVGKYVRSRLEELNEFHQMKSFLLENWYDEEEVKAAKESPYPLPPGLEAWKPEDASALEKKSYELEKSFKKYDWIKKHFPRFFN